MQAQLALEQNDIVIRFPKDLLSQESLSNVLNFIELSARQQKTQLAELAVLEQERAIYLTNNDMSTFLQALEHPPKANEALKRAAQRYKNLINNA